MEGEFKKRINETLEKAKRNDIIAFALLMLLDIDEARKEFPMWEDINFVKITNDETMKNDVHFYALKELKTLREEWRLKWFGDENKVGEERE